MELNGKAAEHHRRRQIVVDALLRAAGTYDGRQLDPTILAAIDIATIATRLTIAEDKLAAIFDGITVLRDLARALGSIEQAALLPSVDARRSAEEAAKAVEAALSLSSTHTEHHEVHTFARRLRPAMGDRPAFESDQPAAPDTHGQA